MGKILTTAAMISCPHGGTVSISSSNTTTKADGAAMARPNDTFSVAGCTFSTPATGPHPCVTVEWQVPATVTKVGGTAVLTDSSVGLCKAGDQIVQGVAMIQTTQAKATAI